MKTMYRRDYVLRLIEQFGRILVALRNRILRREVDEAELRTELYKVATDAGLDLDIARNLDPGMLLMWFAPGGEVDPPRFWLLAELLYLEGLHARQATPPGPWRAVMTRAHALFSRLPSDWKPFDDLATAGERSAELRRLLDEDPPAAH